MRIIVTLDASGLYVPESVPDVNQNPPAFFRAGEFWGLPTQDLVKLLSLCRANRPR